MGRTAGGARSRGRPCRRRGGRRGAFPHGVAHRAAALSFTAEGPDIVWETEPGGSAYLITGPEAVPVTEVFLLAAPKNDGKA